LHQENIFQYPLATTFYDCNEFVLMRTEVGWLLPGNKITLAEEALVAGLRSTVGVLSWQLPDKFTMPLVNSFCCIFSTKVGCAVIGATEVVSIYKRDYANKKEKNIIS
jgi:hypothetical protein